MAREFAQWALCCGMTAALYLPFNAAAQNAPIPDKTPAFMAAEAQLRDAETLKVLSVEGKLLYQRDRVKLDGYQYCSQAVALAERGEFRQSIRAASRALHLGQQQGNDDLVAQSKRDFAIAYSYAGDLDHAEQYAQEALQHKASDARLVAAPVYKVLGDVAARRGRVQEAVGFYTRSIETASDRFRPLAQISLANAYVADGRPREARAIFNGLKLPEDSGLRPFYQRSLGNLLLLEGKSAEAVGVFAAAIKDASGPDAVYHRLWAQEGLARSLLAQNDRTGARNAYLEAVNSSEAIRARFHSEEFKTGLFGDVQRIFDQALTLSMDAGDVDTGWRLSESSRSRALLDVVRERVQLNRTSQIASLSTAPVALEEVANALREGEAIVEFHDVDDRLFAWVARRTGLQGNVIQQSRADLEKAVSEFRSAIVERRQDVGELGRGLYRILIEPLQLAPGERLVIVPHGPLHYLPFQALRDDDAYFIERHAIAIAPSASVAVQLARRKGNAGGQLVAFGNPSVGEKFALPGAEREIANISRQFREKKVFLEREASKLNFLENAGDGQVLHVAAHAEVDSIDPLASRIMFAQEGGAPGFLDAREVYGLNMNRVSLVTLSACESGLGRIARGDEILGFTRSFLTAGASALIVSLWPVSDDSTELLMRTFYAELAKGTEAVDAMQTAQLAVLRRPRFSRPFFWAPFNLVGDWRIHGGG